MAQNKEYYRGINLLGNALENAKASNFSIEQVFPAEFAALLALTNSDAVAQHNRFVVVRGSGGKVLHQLVEQEGVLTSIKYATAEEVNALIATVSQNRTDAETAQTALASQLATLAAEVGAVSLGPLNLTDKTLTIPFTKADGSVINRTVDLASLGIDVQVVSATLDANTYSLTITESNGDSNTVSLKAVVEKVFDERIVAVNEAIALKANLTSVYNTTQVDNAFAGVNGRLNGHDAAISLLQQTDLDLQEQINGAGGRIDVLGNRVDDLQTDVIANNEDHAVKIAALETGANTVNFAGSIDDVLGQGNQDAESRAENRAAINVGTIVVFAGVAYRYAAGPKDVLTSYVLIGRTNGLINGDDLDNDGIADIPANGLVTGSALTRYNDSIVYPLAEASTLQSGRIGALEGKTGQANGEDAGIVKTTDGASLTNTDQNGTLTNEENGPFGPLLGTTQPGTELRKYVVDVQTFGAFVESLNTALTERGAVVAGVKTRVETLESTALKMAKAPVNIGVGITTIAPEASKTADVLFSRINAQGREVQCEFDWYRENDSIKVDSSVAVADVTVTIIKRA